MKPILYTFISPYFLLSYLSFFLSFFLPYLQNPYPCSISEPLFHVCATLDIKYFVMQSKPVYLFRLQKIFYLKSLLSVTGVYISFWCTRSKHVYILHVSNPDWLVHSTFQITWMTITTDNEWKIVNYETIGTSFHTKIYRSTSFH